MHSSLGFFINLLTIIALTSTGNENSVSVSARSTSSQAPRGIRRRGMRTIWARAPEFQVSHLSSASLDKRQGKSTAGAAGAGGAGGAGGSGRGEVIVKAVVDRISTGLATTIAKYSALTDAKVPFPTAAEVSAAMTKSVENVEPNQTVRVLTAYKTAIDGLADRKLSEGGKSGEKKGPTTSKERRQMRSGAGASRGGSAPASTTGTTSGSTSKSGSITSKESIDILAPAFLEVLKKFSDVKAAGGRLPTGAEISPVIQESIRKGDVKNMMEIVTTSKTALEALADTLKSK